MRVCELKQHRISEQYRILAEMLRVARFIKNACTGNWMARKNVGLYALSAGGKVLFRKPKFTGMKKLKSMACKAIAGCARSGTAGFGDTFKKKVSGNRWKLKWLTEPRSQNSDIWNLPLWR